MNRININSKIKVYWKIWRGVNKISEDFDSLNTNLKVFLVGSGNTYWVQPTINKVINIGYDTLEIDIEPNKLSVGTYDLKAIWEKNGARNTLTSTRSGVFSITDNDYEARVKDEVINLVSYVESYGRDGMSSYETAVMRGVNDGIDSELDWVQSVSILSEKVRIANEEVRKANEAERITNENERITNENNRKTAEYRREMVIDGIIEKIEEYKPIVIYGDVVNAPDEEDITSENGLLKLKNRAGAEGKGYVRVRKGVGFASQIQNENTIYEIRYRFDLKEESIAIPKGCVLKFEGGCLENCTLEGSDTIIDANTEIFSNAKFKGTWNIKYVDVRWFGVVIGSNEVDNHDAILAAIKAAKEMKVGSVQFPSGVICTSPIEVRGASQLLFKGSSGRAYYYNDKDCGTIIRAISQGYSLFQLCSHEDNRVSPFGEWSSYSVTIDGINFDGNNMVDHCVSGNWALYLYNSNAKNAKSHGIVIEDYGYPVIIEKVISQSNGGSGIFIKGPSTTVVTLRDVECQYNQGWGIWVEGFAFSTWQNITLQGNKGGGLKILRSSSFEVKDENSYFTTSLSIYNLYTEANGLEDNSPIAGAYGVWIGADEPASQFYKRPQYIKLFGGAITDNSGIFVNCVNGLVLNLTYEKIQLGEKAYCSSITDTSVGSKSGISSALDSTKAVTSYSKMEGKGWGEMPFLHYRCGLMGERGRLQEVLFAFDFSGIEEYKGKTFRMKLSDAAGVEQKYAIPGKSSIESICAYKADAQYSHQHNTAYAETFKGSAEFKVYAGSLLYSRNDTLPVISYNPENVEEVLTLINGDDSNGAIASKTFKYPLLTNKPEVVYGDNETCGMYVDVTLSDDWEWAKSVDHEQDKTLYCKVTYEY